ncbi:5-hydroxytryptamine receptor 3A-like [Halichoeres trimaculatus]|uniref:5-hydroxytryptamine receptor 3A-like n=1 Tax=Halichoeres trimaculatus TaxID=147232 RepID=UPI003D9F1634
MMFAGFFFLLLLTGGSSYNHTEPPDGEEASSQSTMERGSSNNHTEPLHDQFSGEDAFMNFSLHDLDHWFSWEGDSEIDYDVDFDSWHNNYDDLPSHCYHFNMVNDFNLSNKVKFYQTRPTKNSLRPTNVTLNTFLYSILDVKENEQELISYFWIDVYWKNEFIKWEPETFCDIDEISLPSELLWKPDLTIEEVTKKDKLFKTPYLTLRHDGVTYQRNGIVLVSTCIMQYYRFPFDSQTCNLTFKSIQHHLRQIELFPRWTNEKIFQKSRKWMKTESEWLLMNVTVETQKVFNFAFPLSLLVYTMTLKRSSVLYVINFIVPILFFLCLDLASFLISENGGEKLSFKVTVLLAVTVMQLILNDILPSSDRIPLMAVYCIGVFALMMLSLLETILMMYLMEKDNLSQDKEEDKDQSLGEDCRAQRGRVQNYFRDMNKSIPCVRVFDKSPGETFSRLLPKVKEGRSSSQLTKDIHDFESLSNELREVSQKMSLLLSSRKKEQEPGYWTKMTKTLNRIYFIFYIIATSVFLGCVFSVWLHED